MKINITKIAANVGLTQGALSNILAGRRRPHYKTAKKIASVTKTDPILWLEGSPEQLRRALSKNKPANGPDENFCKKQKVA